MNSLTKKRLLVPKTVCFILRKKQCAVKVIRVLATQFGKHPTFQSL